MPSQYCIDPHDQYFQAELLVEFEARGGNVMLLSARDASDDNVLPELGDIERRALETEISADYRDDAPSRGGRPRYFPIPGHPKREHHEHT